MKKLIHPSNKVKAATRIQAASGTANDMLDAFDERIDQLENYDEVYMATEVSDAESATVEAADEYFGQTEYETYGDLVSKECKGMIISKRIVDGEEPGGLVYEADRLGIEDFFDLLCCLEGMCYNGEAVEISDYQYKVV